MDIRKLTFFNFYLFYGAALYGQRISRQKFILLNPQWKGECVADGRPKVPDNLMDRMRRVTIKEP